MLQQLQYHQQNLEALAEQRKEKTQVRANIARLSSFDEQLAEIDTKLSELQKPFREPTEREIGYMVLRDTYQSVKKNILETLKAIPGTFYANTYARKKFNNNEPLEKDGEGDYGLYMVVGAVGLMGSVISTMIISSIFPEYSSLSGLAIPLSVATNTLSAIYENARYKNLKKYQEKSPIKKDK